MTVTEYDEILFDKIGGWLVLPAFVHPFIAILGNLKSSYDLFALAAAKYPIEFQIFFGVTAIISVALSVAWLVSGYLAASLSPIFPKFYIWLNAGSLGLTILVMAIAYFYFKAPPVPEDGADLIKSVIASCIWIPYMLRSKRVKATFYGIPMPQNFALKNTSSPLEKVATDRQEARRERAMSENRTNLSMIQRAGMVLYWAGAGLGAILLVIGVFALFNAPDRFIAIATLVAAALSWLVGRALKYILVGN